MRNFPPPVFTKYFHSNATPALIWEFSKWLHERNEVNFINEVEREINIVQT